jgi:ubiquinone/menaquinone biosynthesis C-methylase UbiE
MAKRVCPWWLGYFLLNPVRRWRQRPKMILTPYVREGMTVLEPGPGMGYFTLDLLNTVGPKGRVIAVDVQPKMLDRLKRRAAKAGVEGRLDARLAPADSMGIADLNGEVDFTLVFAVAHELPSVPKFFAEVAEASRPGACVLFSEPAGHVKADEFEGEVKDAIDAGFVVTDHPPFEVARPCCCISVPNINESWGWREMASVLDCRG